MEPDPLEDAMNKLRGLKEIETPKTIDEATKVYMKGVEVAQRIGGLLTVEEKTGAIGIHKDFQNYLAQNISRVAMEHQEEVNITLTLYGDLRTEMLIYRYCLKQYIDPVKLEALPIQDFVYLESSVMLTIQALKWMAAKRNTPTTPGVG